MLEIFTLIKSFIVSIFGKEVTVESAYKKLLNSMPSNVSSYMPSSNGTTNLEFKFSQVSAASIKEIGIFNFYLLKLYK